MNQLQKKPNGCKIELVSLKKLETPLKKHYLDIHILFVFVSWCGVVIDSAAPLTNLPGTYSSCAHRLGRRSGRRSVGAPN